MTEFAGPSTEGGKYDCPVGEISSQALGRRLTIRLKPDIHWAQGSATLTGVDVARLLLAMADPGNPAYRVDWSDLMTAVSVRGVYGVEVEFRRSHVRPEAMLQIILTPPRRQPAAVPASRRRPTDRWWSSRGRRKRPFSPPTSSTSPPKRAARWNSSNAASTPSPRPSRR